MKKMWKRFWTLGKRQSGGFTLVELIVVIAILAVLAGVGVPVYSGYVKKANMAADQTLVSDVAKALQLYYYNSIASGTEMGSGYVVLTQTGASGDGTVGDAAMQAAFGDAWESTSLAYGDWTDDGLLNYVLNNADSAELIANSTFLTTATPDGLMHAVTNLTDAATTVIKNYNGGDVKDKLKDIVGDEFVNTLNNTGVTEDNEAYETVISNMLVGYFADVLNSSTPEEVMDNQLAGMAVTYAALYAYSETISGGAAIMADIDAHLAQSDKMDNLTGAKLTEYVGTNHPEFTNGFVAYYQDENGPKEQYNVDVNAVLKIMGAVSHISGTYTDADDLSNPDLYSSDSVAEQLNNYISAIKAVAKMDDATIAVLNGLGENDVVIFVSEDGAVSVVPGAVYLASRD